MPPPEHAVQFFLTRRALKVRRPDLRERRHWLALCQRLVVLAAVRRLATLDQRYPGGSRSASNACQRGVLARTGAGEEGLVLAAMAMQWATSAQAVGKQTTLVPRSHFRPHTFRCNCATDSCNDTKCNSGRLQRICTQVVYRDLRRAQVVYNLIPFIGQGCFKQCGFCLLKHRIRVEIVRYIV